MNELKKVMFRIIEIFVTLAVGLLLTLNILKPVYENFGIKFVGNVWVNWFGMSYILFVLYTLIVALFLFKDSNHFRQRLKSYFFWLVFIGAIYIVFIPFVKGENPF